MTARQTASKRAEGRSSALRRPCRRSLRLAGRHSRACRPASSASIVIRYEALRIEPDSSAGANAVVMEARLLGRASLIHLSVPTGTDELHLHARVPGLNSFGEGTRVRISVDAEQAFVFAAN